MAKIDDPIIIDIPALLAKLDSQNKPVIFWDTCSLLDIIRLPIPERRNNIALLDKVIAIKEKIVSRDIISISSEICIAEFNNHIDDYIKILNEESQKISEAYNRFAGFANKVNIGGMPLPEVNLSSYKIELFLVNIIQSIIKETYFAREDKIFADFAHYRTVNKIPPARKKGEYKDCYIWATCLELRKNFADKSNTYFFFSSNTADYCDNEKRFVTEIAHEATLYNIGYFSDFNVAYGILTGLRII